VLKTPASTSDRLQRITNQWISRRVVGFSRAAHRWVANAVATAVIVNVSWLSLAGTAHAGEQIYEPLTASVRSALAAAVLDRAAPQPRFASTFEQTDWMADMAARLPGRHKPTPFERSEFLQMARYEAQRAGLDPHLVLGLIEVESNFRRHAISSAGARGYMQVMPFWTRLIGDGEPSGLFDARTNLRYGCVILRHYLDMERGDLYRALGRYNGSLGRPEYPDMVLAAWKRWAYEPGPRLQQVSAPGAPSALR
jgi:soluble lytic murein transglycosylase-like protein